MKTAVLMLVAVSACGGTKASPEPSPQQRVEPVDAATSDAAPEAERPAEPKPAAPACAAKQNPAGCPDSEPNVNARCKKNGLACTYGASCCPPVYVCNKLRFEARFQSCPK